jgi:SAM-dependent methyltransferase
MPIGVEGEMGELLRPVGNMPLLVKSGYVDVLGDRDPIGPHRGQQVFRREALPLIYERLWRPAVSRFFFGLGGPGAKEERQMTMSLLDVLPGDRVIDVGCGPGNYTRDLAALCGDGLAVGVDASEAMVAAAAKRGGRANLSYLRADACALPFRDGTFDVACSVGVIHMIEQPLSAVAEMVRVLAPGGRLAIVASCARKDRQRGVRGGVTVFGRDELTAALRDHGLIDIDRQIVRRGQFVSARKREEQDGR